MAMKRRPRNNNFSVPVTNASELQAIIDAISRLDQDTLEKHGAWNDLSELSTNTTFEGVEPHPDGIYKTGKNHFQAIATVYVTLNYGDKKDNASMSDSYPAKVGGFVEGKNKVEVDSITVDTSSFYK